MRWHMDVLHLSLTAAVLILAVVIVRALTLHKLPKKTFPILWGIVICRLLIPFSIPSLFSFYTGVNRLRGMFTEVPLITSPAEMTRVTRIAELPNPLRIVPVGGSGSGAAISTMTVIWLIGVCACALYFIVAYLKCRKEFQTSLPVENELALSLLREQPLRRQVQIRQSDLINTPLTYGVIRPVILMPKAMDWTDETALRYILAHELVHIRRLDALTKLVLAFTVCVHWFNPLVWLMVVLANRDIELSCDETVVRAFGETRKSDYALTLIGMEEKKRRVLPLFSSFSTNSIEERIVAIMKMRKTTAIGTAASLVLILGTVTAFATSAAMPESEAAPLSSSSLDNKTDIATSIVLSTIDEPGKARYSTDNGATWLSEEEYEQANPSPDVVWWTYDEYKAWLEEEKASLQSIVGEKGWNPSDGWFVWTAEKVDSTIAKYEGILEEIKQGIKVSKSVDGNDEVMLSSNLGELQLSTAFEMTVEDDQGNSVKFGPYDSKEEMLTELQPYVDSQVQKGAMTQPEADEILNKAQENKQ